MSEEMLQQARDIGAILRDRHNMQPMAIPEADKDGIMQTLYIPPPSLNDVSLKDLGKQTMGL